MKWFLTLAVCMLLAHPTVNGQDRIWDTSDKNKLEAYSLFELISLITLENFATSDDATIRYGSEWFARGSAHPEIFLNDVQLHLSSWNTLSFHAIPVTVSQIDSILVIQNHTQREGLQPGIHIYSKADSGGIKVRANMKMGNRSGDPGPYVYTEMASRNIERLGPISDAGISYKSKNFALQTGLKQFVHAVTDPLQFLRMTPFSFGDRPYRHAKIRSTSGFIFSELQHGIFRHEFQAAVNSANDFLFSGLYGTEIPAEKNLQNLSLSSLADINSKWSLKYQISYNNNELNNYPNKEEKWMGWNQFRTSAKVSSIFKSEKHRHRSSITFQDFTMKSDISETLNSQLFSASHISTLWLNESTHSNLYFGLSKNSALATSAEFSIGHQVTAINFLRFSAGYEQQLPIESNSFWYWTVSRGFAKDTLNLGSAEFPEQSKKSFFRFNWILEDSHKRFDLGFSYFSLRDHFLYKPNFSPVGRRIFTSDFEFEKGNYSFVQIPFKAEISINPALQSLIQYSWTKAIAADSDYYDFIPEHKLLTQLSWIPAQSFKFWMRLRALSSAYWHEAAGIDNHGVSINYLQEDYYLAASDARFQVDIGLWKSFYNNQLAFSLHLENINNTQYRNHPVSPGHAFTIFLGAHLELF